MGLDLVDIALSIEARLGVRLPDDFGSRSRTVADLVSEIAKAVPSSREHHVERVRQALRKAVGQEVQESTSLATIFPIATRRNRWRVVGREIAVPDLEFNPRVRRVRRCGVWLIATACLAAAAWHVHAGSWWSLLYVPIAAGVWIALGAALIEPWRAWFAPGLSSVGDLVDRCEAVRAGSAPGLSREDYAMRAIRDVLVTEFGIDPKSITPEARLVEDLGLD